MQLTGDESQADTEINARPQHKNMNPMYTEIATNPAIHNLLPLTSVEQVIFTFSFSVSLPIAAATKASTSPSTFAMVSICKNESQNYHQNKHHS